MTISYKRPFLYSYQQKILDSPARFTVTEASTKVGKTASHIIWLFEQSLNPKLKTGDSVWWVAPVYGQAEIAFQRFKNQVTDKNFFQVNESKLRLTLPTGVNIQFKSADKPDSLYGDDVYAAVFDEFTRAKEAAWFALRSTLTATKAKCKFIGNVKGKGNWGYKLALKAKHGAEDYEYFKITAYDAVEEGCLDIKEIKAAEKDLPPHVFKELYLAEASENASCPFSPEMVRRCLTPLSTAPPEYYGIDLAKASDYTVIIGLDAQGNVAHYQRFQKDWMHTREEIMRLPRHKPIEIDSTGVGDPIVEDLQRHFQAMHGFKFTGASKQPLMEGLAAAIHKREIGFPDGPIKDELEIFEYTYTPTGVRYTAPQGFHDDCVCALALANKCRADRKFHGQYAFA